MVKENKVRDAIVVGIFSVNRSQEYNDASLGQLYGEFLVETVMPFIEQNYRALKGPENTFLMGSSYGSAISISLRGDIQMSLGESQRLLLPEHFFTIICFV